MTQVSGAESPASETPDIRQSMLEQLAAVENNTLLFLQSHAQHHGVKFDQRWLAIGVTDLQKGFMAVARSIREGSIEEAEAPIVEMRV